LSHNDTNCSRNRKAIIDFPQPPVYAVSTAVRFYRIFEHANEILKNEAHYVRR